MIEFQDFFNRADYNCNLAIDCFINFFFKFIKLVLLF